MKVSLEIVIVNWNAGAQLVGCLQSISATTREGLELTRVVVVDNASSDAFASHSGVFPFPLTIIRNEENRGFAAACNQGAMHSPADYLLFLNPDTKLTPGCLSTAIAFMQSPGNSNVAVCGIQLLDEHGQITRSCSRFPRPSHFYIQIGGLNRFFSRRFHTNFMNEWDHRETREVDVVTGAFFLVRSQVFRLLGGFDERFFVYLEDVDFLRAAHEAGWRSYYLTETQAFHIGGGCSRQAKGTRLFYSLQSRILYGFKHFRSLNATALLIATLLIEPLTRLVWAAWRGLIPEIRETLQAYAMLLRTLPGVTARRNTSAKEG